MDISNKSTSDRSANPRRRETLNPKQQVFVREYLIDLNATAAYKRAGYKGTGRAAENAASRLLGFVGVQKAIQEAMAERARRTEQQADDVVRELGLIAFGHIGQILDFTGESICVKDAKDIPEVARRALASLTVKRYVEGHGDDARDVELLEFKMLDKLQALIKYGQHLGMFNTKFAHSSTDGEPIQIQQIEICGPEGPPPSSGEPRSMVELPR
jgi:phage terminase small subunit